MCYLVFQAFSNGGANLAALDKRSHIVNEIIETEDSYLTHLRVMVEVDLIFIPIS